MPTQPLDYICCYKCKSDLERKKEFLICKNCGRKYKIIDNDIFCIMPPLSPDAELSRSKWEKSYQNNFKNKTDLKLYRTFKKQNLPNTYPQITEAKKINKDLTFLEIGSGYFYTGEVLAKKVNLVIGLDFSLSALKVAKKILQAHGIENYLFIQGDVAHLPIKANRVDLIYGGGVIEHFKNTQQCINELYRVLKKDGISFNAVPCLNLGSLTYRQIWGNIPYFPILKQIAEFIHIKVLQGKYMIFGYELSFLGSTLKKMHKQAGFKDVLIGKFNVKLTFDFISSRLLKNVFIKIANNSRLFWPMIKVIAKK